MTLAVTRGRDWGPGKGRAVHWSPRLPLGARLTLTCWELQRWGRNLEGARVVRGGTALSGFPARAGGAAVPPDHVRIVVVDPPPPSSHLSVISFYVNGLNAPIKRLVSIKKGRKEGSKQASRLVHVYKGILLRQQPGHLRQPGWTGLESIS